MREQGLRKNPGFRCAPSGLRLLKRMEWIPLRSYGPKSIRDLAIFSGQGAAEDFYKLASPR